MVTFLVSEPIAPFYRLRWDCAIPESCFSFKPAVGVRVWAYHKHEMALLDDANETSAAYYSDSFRVLNLMLNSAQGKKLTICSSCYV